jgi:hypothetical protein
LQERKLTNQKLKLRPENLEKNNSKVDQERGIRKVTNYSVTDAISNGGLMILTNVLSVVEIS